MTLQQKLSRGLSLAQEERQNFEAQQNILNTFEFCDQRDVLSLKNPTCPTFLLYFFAISLTTGSSITMGLSLLSMSSALSGEPKGL